MNADHDVNEVRRAMLAVLPLLALADSVQAQDAARVQPRAYKIAFENDKLRVLEQKINGSKQLSDEDKITLQQYITGVYGSLTTFNVLFREESDKFVGASTDRDG